MFSLRLDIYTTFEISYLQLVTDILLTWFQDSYSAFMDYFLKFRAKHKEKLEKVTDHPHHMKTCSKMKVGADIMVQKETYKMRFHAICRQLAVCEPPSRADSQ